MAITTQEIDAILKATSESSDKIKDLKTTGDIIVFGLSNLYTSMSTTCKELSKATGIEEDLLIDYFMMKQQ